MLVFLSPISSPQDAWRHGLFSDRNRGCLPNNVPTLLLILISDKAHLDIIGAWISSYQRTTTMIWGKVGPSMLHAGSHRRNVAPRSIIVIVDCEADSFAAPSNSTLILLSLFAMPFDLIWLDSTIELKCRFNSFL